MWPGDEDSELPPVLFFKQAARLLFQPIPHFRSHILK